LKRKICVAMKMYPPPVVTGEGRTSLPFQAGSRRSSQLAGFLLPTSPMRVLFEMKAKMPVYQPVHSPVASLNFASMSFAFGAM
jgi:hypothetical protein